MYSTNLAQVVDIVVSHQGIEIKTQLIGQLMSALVLPAPEHYRPLLRRLAALSTSLAPVLTSALRWHLSSPFSDSAAARVQMVAGFCLTLPIPAQACRYARGNAHGV